MISGSIPVSRPGGHFAVPPIPYFVFSHGMLDPWFRRTYPLKHVKKALYWRAGGHKIFRDARGVFFTSEEEKRVAGQSFRPYQCNGVTVGFGTTGAKGDSIELQRAFIDAFPELRGKKLLALPGTGQSQERAGPPYSSVCNDRGEA